MQPETAGILGVVWVFGWAVVLIWAWHLRSRQRERRLRMIHEERMKAMEKGIPLPEFPELDAHRRPRRPPMPINPRWPLGVAALVTTVGLGLALALHMSGDAFHNDIWPFGLVGPFLGLGLVLHYYLTRTGERNGHGGTA